MELRTYTGLWKVEKRLYKFYDIALPYPVSIRQLGIVFGVAIPWFILMGMLGMPFSPPVGYLVWLAPPIGLAWAANRPLTEGKTLTDFVSSQVKYWLTPRYYTALSGTRKGTATKTTTVAKAYQLSEEPSVSPKSRSLLKRKQEIS